jgi:hypothetical protein
MFITSVNTRREEEKKYYSIICVDHRKVKLDINN